jgi:hypothetical protein
MSKIFRFKYLALIVLVVAAIAGIGNAAALTFTNVDQNVVEGSSDAFTADASSVAYTIGSSGEVTATITTVDTFDTARASLTGGSDYQACTTAATNITCVFPKANLSAGTNLYIVATKD